MTATQKPGHAWRRYPVVSKDVGAEHVRIHDHDQFSTRHTPGTEFAAKVLEAGQPRDKHGNLLLKPPGQK